MPTLDCYIKGRLVKKGLVDGGAQICIMNENVMQNLGLHINEVLEIRVKMANNSKAKCLGLVKNVKVEALGIKKEIDFYIVSTKGNGYPLILGRPWLMKVGALQDWETGKLICKNKDKKKVIYNMKEQQQEGIHDESTESDSQEEWSEHSSDDETGSSTTEEESSIEVMGIRFTTTQEQGREISQGLEELGDQETIVTQKEEMIDGMLSPTLTHEEKKEYTTMLSSFPNLFVKDYSAVRGVDVIEHHISLKSEVKPKAQKLRRLGTIKEQALLKEVRKLLAAGFIYLIEDSEWVSPVVVTPKKNGKWRVCVDYRPLNEATKKDHFPLPFQDEILNEVAGYEKYAVCDGYSGYFQIRIAEEDQKKTTFITPWGCYAF